MKPLSNHRITKFVAAAALAGMSIVSAYAVPNYVTPADSPIDATTITSVHSMTGGSVSDALDNFNTYLQAIQDQLDLNAVTGDTVRTPDFGSGVKVLDVDFVAAVGAAVLANPANTAGIVSAAVQYKPAKVKDILKAAATANPSAVAAAVTAASQVDPLGAANAAAGAISGLIASSGTGANNGLIDDAAAAAAIETTRTLIENVAKAAVLATKLATDGTVPLPTGPTSQQSIRAKEVAAQLMDTFLTDAGTAGSNAELFLDDVARGAVSGAAAFLSTSLTKSDVALAMIAKFASHGALNTEENVVNFAMGAMRSAIPGATPASNSAAGVASALAAEATVGLAHATAINLGAAVQIAVRNTPADPVGAFNSNVAPGDYAHIYAALSGATQASPGSAGDFVTAAFSATNAPVGALFTATMKRNIISGATTGASASVGKIITNAIASSNSPMTAEDAISAAIPAATELQSGLATLAAMKNNGVALTTPNAVAVLNAALLAAGDASYQKSFVDIALYAAKARKDIDNDLIDAAIAHTSVNGWEAGIAAFIVANNPADVIPSASGNNKAAAIAAAFTKGGSTLQNSVQLATELVVRGRKSALTIFDDAVSSLNGNTLAAAGVVPAVTLAGQADPKSVLFAVGALKDTLTVPALAAALRLKSTSGDESALLDAAISLNKKAEANTRLGYETALDVIAHPDNTFDVVDHKILTNPKAAYEIAIAAVAAAPEYAHYSARAAAFRSPALVGKIATGSIQFAHMRTNTTDDPAAVAAISAAVVLGVHDANLTTLKETAFLNVAITGLVKGALSFPNNYGLNGANDKQGLQGLTANFPEATGAGSTLADVTSKRSKGTAGVLTGAIAQLQRVDADYTYSDLAKLSPLSAAAITAAVKVMKSHALAFAQAAGAAAQAVAVANGTTFSSAGFLAIAAALTAGGASDTGFENAARVGAAQFDAAIYGAGFAGISNTGPYSHISGTGSPVTSIAGF